MYRYGIKLNAEENGQFELRFAKSGLKYKARFIKAMILDREMKVVKLDKAAMDYYIRLTNFYPAEIDHCALCHPQKPPRPARSLVDLRPGERARVANIVSHGAIRQRMLDMGLLPNALIELERFGPGGESVWIKCLGAQLALRREEAETVLIAEGI